MAQHPESVINFEIYENSVDYLGVASVSCPNIDYITQEINGAGILGNVDAVLIGMINGMEATINFRSPTDAASKLLTPVKHLLDMRVAEQHWDNVNGQRTIKADKYIMGVIPKTFTFGDVAPATTANSNTSFSVYYYAGYENGSQIWEIDQFNYIFKIRGTDYMAAIRKALGK